ncbi:hypothetical protein F2Q69_00050770 [Brassica cretica]|uniref:Uncharacterized protein n=1 Tax=Brassica cretica TaxID=69181 RepID=A0A8S9Q7J2_BRACR|nr:hypothetical protein F2Q69_00050770 [Brassica cretica]
MKVETSDEARFWGAFGLYAFVTSAYFFAGLGGGFLTFVICVSMLLGWIAFCLSVKSFDYDSIKSPMFYVIALAPCLLYSVYFGGFLALFLIEKTGMIGVPPPFGFYLADVAVAAVIGLVTGLCMGPIIPICDRWLAKSSILKFLLHFTVAMLAVSSQFFPYSKDAPKRVVLQHTVFSAGLSIPRALWDGQIHPLQPVGRLERLADESHSVVLSEASSRGFIAPFDRCVAGRVLEYFRLRPISRGYSDPD